MEVISNTGLITNNDNQSTQLEKVDELPLITTTPKRNESKYIFLYGHFFHFVCSQSKSTFLTFRIEE